MGEGEPDRTSAGRAVSHETRANPNFVDSVSVGAGSQQSEAEASLGARLGAAECQMATQEIGRFPGGAPPEIRTAGQKQEFFFEKGHPIAHRASWSGAIDPPNPAIASQYGSRTTALQPEMRRPLRLRPFAVADCERNMS